MHAGERSKYVSWRSTESRDRLDRLETRVFSRSSAVSITGVDSRDDGAEVWRPALGALRGICQGSAREALFTI